MNRDERLAEVFAECLEGPPSEWTSAIESACLAHPDLADGLRELLTALPSPEHASPAITVDGFRVIGQLGAGAMGSVYLAEPAGEPKGQRIALKVIRAHLADQPQARARFRREAAVLRKLDHPSIVRVLDHGEHGQRPYLALEFVRGVTLAEALRKLVGRDRTSLTGRDLAGALDLPPATLPASYVEAVLELMVQAADAIAHAHRHGVLHRDLKPANLMVAPDGRVVVVDFGLAAFAGDPHLTQTGARVGSLPYMAPELLRRDTRGANEQTDVYALGVTLYELLSTTLPFVDGDELLMLRRIHRGDSVPIRRRCPDVPRAVEVLCLAAMDVEPRHRTASARQLADDLTRVLQHQPISTRPPSMARRLRTLMRRRPMETAITAAAGLLVVLAAGIAALQHRARTQTMRAASEVAWRRAVTDLARANNLAGMVASIRPLDERQLPWFDAWLAESRSLQQRLVREYPASIDRLREFPHAMSTTLFAMTLPASAWDLPEDDERALATATLRVGCHDSLPGHLRRRQIVQRERDVAATLADRSVTGEAARAAWQRALATFADRPALASIHLEPQLGLLPVFEAGRDLPRFLHVATGDVATPGTERSAVLFDLVGGDDREPPFFIATSPLTRRQWIDITGDQDPANPRDELPARVQRAAVERLLQRYGMQSPTARQWQLAGDLFRMEPREGPASPLKNPEGEAVVFPVLRVTPGHRPWRLVQFSADTFGAWQGRVFGRQGGGACWRTRHDDAVGEYLEVLTLSGLTFCALVAPDAVWDPRSQGRWDSVVLEVKTRNDAGWGIGNFLSPVLEQDGKWYFANEWSGSGGDDEWHPTASAPIEPGRFFHIHPRDWAAGAASPIGEGDAPDFGPEAAPMRFGFGVLAISNGVYREAMDDWRVTIRY